MTTITPPPENGARYAKPIILLHWLTVLLLVVVFSLIEIRVFFAKGSEMRELMKTLHFMFGLTVLLLTVLRLSLRFGTPAPVITPPPPALLVRLAGLGHALLYLALIALPIAGWLTLSAAGKPIPFFGLELPPLLAPDKALASSIKELHGTVGNLLYFVIAAHVLAALLHRYVLRDDTVRRMLWPCRAGRRTAEVQIGEK